MANIVTWFINNFVWIQIGSILLSVVLLIAIIRVAIKIDYYSDRREYGWDVLHFKNLHARKLDQLWKRVLKNIKRPEPSAWKKILVEVDEFFDDTLKGLGYIGSSEEERLGQIGSDKLSNVDELSKAHAEIKTLSGDPALLIEHERAKEILREYRLAFRQLGLLK